ncbi:MAG: hypothetical protein GC168_04265 [Candidatus Hydrogenedens sp.]|nr:hypothetical protein [Candidatus Hydrogenedens sp.]
MPLHAAVHFVGDAIAPEADYQYEQRFAPQEVVQIDAFPYNRFSDVWHPMVGVISSIGAANPATWEPGYLELIVDYVDGLGYWDHLHLDERALSKATPEQIESLDPFLQYWIIDDDGTDESVSPYIEWALRRFFPVKNVDSTAALRERARDFGFEPRHPG